MSGYDPLSDGYHIQHDWSSAEPLTHTITRAVSALAGVEPQSGPPISESIDPDSLNRLFNSGKRSSCNRDHVTFTHLGCTVTVYRDGHVVAFPPE